MNTTPFSNEAQLLNYQFLALVRCTLAQAPDALEKILGIDLETAQSLANMSPSEMDSITKTNIVYFKPRISSDLLKELVKSARNNDPVELDCNLQHAVASAV